MIDAADVAMVGPLMHDEPLGPLCQEWLRQLNIASEHKKKVFGDRADECLRFYMGTHEFLYEAPYLKRSLGFKLGDSDMSIQPPMFRVTANLTAEFVQLFGPMLYSRNPIRTVRPRHVIDLPAGAFGIPDQNETTPEMAQQLDMLTLQAASLFAQAQNEQQQQGQEDAVIAMLLEKYLNYTPNELDLKSESRKAINEGLIKGRGVMWVEKFQPPESPIALIGSFYDSVDNLYVDADAEDLRDAQWIARRCVHPTWQVERDYGLAPGTLKGNRESLGQQATIDSESAKALDKRKRGETMDTIVYYKIWSRMGLGGRFKGPFEKLRAELDQYGDYVYLVVAKNVPYPLNIPRGVYNMEDGQAPNDIVRQAVAWPIPFWADSANPWPFAELDFHQIPRQSWPMAHMVPGLVYQKFLDWLYSIYMSKTYRTHRDIYLVDKTSEDEAKEALTNGEDQAVVPIKKSPNGKLSDFFEQVQFAPQTADNWKVGEKIEQLFQRATGMNDVMYAESNKQMRSAEEASLKGDFVRLRPDDMGQCVEDWQTNLARKEALAARWELTAKDIAPILGKLASVAWKLKVESTDVPYVVRELEYRLEAGSTKKPNADLDLANSNDAAQFVFPQLMQVYFATGDPTQVNAFLQYWGKARQLDVDKFMMPPINVAPPAPPGGGQPPPGQSPPPAPQGGPPQ
jgi:hypothetical protein